VVIAVLGYFFLTVSHPSSLTRGGVQPPRGKDVEIKRTLIPLQNRSDISNRYTPAIDQMDPNVRAVADEVFRKAKDCLGASLVLEDFALAEARCQRRKGVNCSDANALLAYSIYPKSKIEAANSEILNCPSENGDDLSKSYFDAMTKAAKAGNVSAQACYIEGNFFPKLSPEDELAYKTNATQFINDAFARGDWSIVDLLKRNMSGPGRANGRILSLLAPNGSVNLPEMFYKLNRLLRSGAIGEYAGILDAEAAAPYEHADQTLNPGGAGLLDASQINEANSWAQATYSTYFSNSPKLENSPGSECPPVASPQ